MSARIVGLSLLPAALLAFSTPLMGQTQTDNDSVAELGKRVDALEASMLTKEDLESFKSQLLAAVGAAGGPAQPAEAPPAAKRQMAPIPAAQPEDVARMEFEALKDVVLQNRTILEQVAQNVSGRDGQSSYVPNIWSAMEDSEQFRKSMKEAVHMSLDQQGTLVIRNKTHTGKSLRIRATGKDTTVYVPAGTEVRVPVPVGTVSTELVGHEAAKNWMLGPPNNEQEIDILPAPPAPVVISPPLYEAPVVVWY
mgnify:CR=1 FL=1